MLPFAITLKPSESPYRQVVYAATKAVVSGEMKPGDTFPSVRELSQALKLNPNTCQKVIAELVRDGLLEVRPGIGTVVTTARRSSAAERKELLSGQVEQLLVEAKRLGLTKTDVQQAITTRWSHLFGDGRDETR